MTDQAHPEVYVISQFMLSCLVRLEDSFVAKQPTSRAASVRRSQRAVRRRGCSVARRRGQSISAPRLGRTSRYPRDYSTHENQLILAKQLTEHGANVNVETIPESRTPLHIACCGSNVTNLDFIELLLEAGADPNAQDQQGLTPLMWTTKFAPGAAKFLLNWPAMDVNVTWRVVPNHCSLDSCGLFRAKCTP